MAPSVLICAGEASSDLHARDVILALRQASPEIALFGMGGPCMRAVGFEAQVRAEDVSVAGLTEVVWALPRLWGCLRRLVELARSRRPCVALLLDLPDFNLRLARRLKALGIPVVYYIGPQVWAWRKGRLKILQQLVDDMLVILPFEEAFYRRHGMPARFVGHPLVQQQGPPPDAAGRQRARQRLGVGDTPCIAILPGSRAKELSRHLPEMLAAMHALSAELGQTLQVLLPVASTLSRAAVEQLMSRQLPAAGGRLDLHLLDGEAPLALLAADVAVVCSGTATLQAALQGRPMVVVYRVSRLTYAILRRLVDLPYIGLVNLIAQRPLVAELLQEKFCVENLVREVRRLLPTTQGGVAHAAMQQELLDLRAHLGAKPTAQLVAQAVLQHE
jgi:lipid-A-disaccharide synthase